MVNAYLLSHSQVISPMITGTANFPVARNEKRGRAADRKADALYDWEKRAKAAVMKKLLDAQPDEEKSSHAWRVVERDLKSSLVTIAEIDAGRYPGSRPFFVSNMTSKVERLALNGEVEIVRQALSLVEVYNKIHAKPAVSDRHKFWGLKEIAQQAAAKKEARSQAVPETIA